MDCDDVRFTGPQSLSITSVLQLPGWRIYIYFYLKVPALGNNRQHDKANGIIG